MPKLIAKSSQKASSRNESVDEERSEIKKSSSESPEKPKVESAAALRNNTRPSRSRKNINYKEG